MDESDMWEQIEKVVDQKSEIDYTAYRGWYDAGLSERCQGGEWNGAQSAPMQRIQEPPDLPWPVVTFVVGFVVYLLILWAGAL